jgi:hypothetical protein
VKSDGGEKDEEIKNVWVMDDRDEGTLTPRRLG